MPKHHVIPRGESICYYSSLSARIATWLPKYLDSPIDALGHAIVVRLAGLVLVGVVVPALAAEPCPRQTAALHKMIRQLGQQCFLLGYGGFHAGFHLGHHFFALAAPSLPMVRAQQSRAVQRGSGSLCGPGGSAQDSHTQRQSVFLFVAAELCKMSVWVVIWI